VEVKLISVYDGIEGTDFIPSNCKEEKGMDIEGTEIEKIFSRKFYEPSLSCCEMCTRTPECKVWTAINDGGLSGTCRLFSSMTKKVARADPADEEAFPRGWVSGVSEDRVGTWYMGCGWSFSLNMFAPCINQGTPPRPGALSE
jgi:hypothetical protein